MVEMMESDAIIKARTVDVINALKKYKRNKEKDQFDLTSLTVDQIVDLFKENLVNKNLLKQEFYLSIDRKRDHLKKVFDTDDKKMKLFSVCHSVFYDNFIDYPDDLKLLKKIVSTSTYSLHHLLRKKEFDKKTKIELILGASTRSSYCLTHLPKDYKLDVSLLTKLKFNKDDVHYITRFDPKDLTEVHYYYALSKNLGTIDFIPKEFQLKVLYRFHCHIETCIKAAKCKCNVKDLKKYYKKHIEILEIVEKMSEENADFKLQDFIGTVVD